MRTYLSAVAISLVLVATPVFAQTTDTQAQIAALQAQIMQLTKLLAALISQKGTSPATVPPPSSCFVPVNDLYMGRTDTQTNGEVSKLQQFLLDQGYGDPDGDSGFLLAKPTGYYGEKTATAVMKWQKAHGMDFVTLTSGVGKQTRAKMQEACGKPVVAQCVKYDDPPVITSISPASGPVGTTFTLQGCNFMGFESDKLVSITNSNGIKVNLYGAHDGSNTSAQIMLPASVCKVDTGYSGYACPGYVDIVPGTYSIVANSYGGKSNSVIFTVTSPGTDFRDESAVPSITYNFPQPGSGATSQMTEPVFGEGVVVDRNSSERIPANVKNFAGYGGAAGILRMTYVNKTRLSNWSGSKYDGAAGTVYLACSMMSLSVGTTKVIGKTVSYQCNPGAMGMITTDGRDIPLVSDWAAN